jgi:RNA-directed DNA polymerase
MSNTVDISLDSVLSTENMERAWAAVKANAGAGGVDGKGIVETEAHLKCHWPVIREKLVRGDYRPAAVRAVDMAKPGGGTRRLGIPTMQDRLIQQALHQVPSAAFDGDMSEHSWGFRFVPSARRMMRSRPHAGMWRRAKNGWRTSTWRASSTKSTTTA